MDPAVVQVAVRLVPAAARAEVALAATSAMEVMAATAAGDIIAASWQATAALAVARVEALVAGTRDGIAIRAYIIIGFASIIIPAVVPMAAMVRAAVPAVAK